jgi:phospholipid/cholesterol/gamma-HCH transport system ATP-binding protein
MDRSVHPADDTVVAMKRVETKPPKPPPAEMIVRLVHVSKSFGPLHVLRNVSIEFPRGQATVVLGPSGCGKSVMLKHIIGLLRPDAGEVWFNDVRVDRLSERELVPVRRQFGFLFQQSALFDSMTVRANVAFPLVEHARLPAAQREERVRHVLEMVGMLGSIDAMPAQLSGGQRKRVALARAIVLEPQVILYDEPTTGLDPIRADVINELILKLESELHVTSIVVTHDLAGAFKVARSMVMLYDGAVIATGTPDDIRRSTEPAVQRFLAGEAGADDLDVAGAARSAAWRTGG